MFQQANDEMTAHGWTAVIASILIAVAILVWAVFGDDR